MSNISDLDALDGYVSDVEMARIRRTSVRTLRTERQSGEGPPYTHDRRRVYYSISQFREWLAENTRMPVKAHRVSMKPARKRILETAASA
jgi:hypothetical protein